ncbi:MAG TPA: T9SS type A sorting domain-containing protein [Chitinophagales bacterium]|nr:T9SS type A sorting domain-containing protein [Chitinophagales bacterium]
MKSIITLLIFSLLTYYSAGQAPGINWQNAIGGNATDLATVIEPAYGGGYFIGGYSNSDAAFDKSERYKGATALYDYWIVKCDAYGNILWENTIGGRREDWNSCIYPTDDNGCILGGSSASSVGADKTENSIGIFGQTDYWILKLDANGEIVWQNTIGSTTIDFMHDMCATPDGGYMLFGESYGGIDGDKTVGSYGGYDYWLIKVDATGTILWQKSYGGSAYDYARKIIPAIGGGYYLAGISYSNINGTKFENSRGMGDYWVIKIDDIGNEIWQKTIGSVAEDELTDILETQDGDLIICGTSYGAIGGDKTMVGFGNADYWILKLNNDGELIWQQAYGGSNVDGAAAIAKTSTGQIRIAGHSSSPISGNKTVASTVATDFWILQISPTGDIQWQQNVAGNNQDVLSDMIVNASDETVFVGFGYSTLGYDKTEPGYGSYDYWVVALADTCAAEVCNDFDDNCDGLIDNEFADSVFVVVTGPLEFCSPSSVQLTAYYTGTSIQWKRNGNPIVGAVNSTYYATKNGNYTATTMSDCGSATSEIITVIVNSNPNANISALGPTTFCPGESVTLNVTPIIGCSYQWYKGPSLLTGETSLTYIATTSGNYKCKVTKTATGCSKTSNTISVSATCKVEESEIVEILTFPNPATNSIFISSKEDSLGNIYLYNASGMLLLNLKVETEIVEIDVSKYASGQYWIRVGASVTGFMKE